MTTSSYRDQLCQRTIDHVIRAEGPGVHSGQVATIVLRPAPVNTGVVFRRVDCSPAVEIRAHHECVVDTQLSTCIGNGTIRIATVEHLVSAIAGLGIDNLYIDLNQEELPIMDGSSALFVMLLQAAGCKLQHEPKRFIKVIKPVQVEQGDKYASLTPYDGFELSCLIDFSARRHPEFNSSNQFAKVDFSTTTYIREVSRARTFGFLADLDMLRAKNLGKGASLDNTLVFDDQSYMNPEKRYNDECVRHKILDAVGDLYLLGNQVIGSFFGCKTGHALNYALLRQLAATPDAYEVVTYENDDCPIKYFGDFFDGKSDDAMVEAA